MKICIIIPTYNESRLISELIRKIKEQGFEVIVVDDGSDDNTAGLAQNSGALVLRSVSNQGKGASLKKGFNYALSKGFDAVIIMDGDGQHLPEDIPSFLRIAEKSQAGILIGNRMSIPKSMPLERFLTNKFMSWLISKITRQKIADTQCGFRLIKKEVLEKLKLKTAKYEIESEMLIQAARLGFRIESVPITTIYRGTKSQINPLMDTLRFIKFIAKELWTTKP